MGSSSKHSCKRLRLDEPWHGNVLLSCGPHKLEPKQQLQEFNADFVPWYGALVCFCGWSWQLDQLADRRFVLHLLRNLHVPWKNAGPEG